MPSPSRSWRCRGGGLGEAWWADEGGLEGEEVDVGDGVVVVVAAVHPVQRGRGRGQDAVVVVVGVAVGADAGEQGVAGLAEAVAIGVDPEGGLGVGVDAGVVVVDEAVAVVVASPVAHLDGVGVDLGAPVVAVEGVVRGALDGVGALQRGGGVAEAVRVGVEVDDGDLDGGRNGGGAAGEER